MPRVTALVTVYNEETWLGDALDSLFAQSLSEIEVLVIDDGSTDRTPEVLAGFDDPRLVVDRQPRIGRAAALAHGVGRAGGGYLAILDADDRAYPERLARQADFLDATPEVAWVGCGEERQDSQRVEHAVRLYPGDDAAIRRMAARCIPYCHSGVMFRTSLREEGLNYDPSVPYLIDFEFFLRVAERHRVANLQEALVMRRLRDASFFQRTYPRRRQNRALARLSAAAVARFRLPPWYYAFPLGRLAYDLVPNPLKRGVRRLAGLRERGAV
jgi:glycosyltransferase involved in cell wall biosynthesis